MPGPVSDSYDPEFSTAGNKEDIADCARELTERIGECFLGAELKSIVAVAQGPDGELFQDATFSEKDLRIIRFCLIRFAEEL